MTLSPQTGGGRGVVVGVGVVLVVVGTGVLDVVKGGVVVVQFGY